MQLLRIVVGTAVCALAVAACGTAATHSSSPATRRVSTTASTMGTTTAVTNALDGQIISAWLAAERAFHDAALTSDPNQPELAATTVDPLLKQVRINLERMRADGYLAKGPTYYGNPSVNASRPGSAVVVSCVHGEEDEFVAATGKPVPGVLGQSDFEFVTSAMQLTSRGWKLASQSVEVGGCTGS